MYGKYDIVVKVAVGTPLDEIAEAVAEAGEDKFEDSVEYDYPDGNDTYSDSGWEQGFSTGYASFDDYTTFEDNLYEAVKKVDPKHEGEYRFYWPARYEDEDGYEIDLDEGLMVLVIVAEREEEDD